jgi:hypothetical protein
VNINETKQLLAEIALIDGREISDEAVKIWADILQLIPLDIAREAHKLCRQDDQIRYLEPKHIYAKAKQAAQKMIDEERRIKQEAQSVEEAHKRSLSKPAPMCRHELPIVRCDHCCQWMFRYHKAQHGHLPYGDKECTEIMTERRIPTTKVLEPLPR